MITIPGWSSAGDHDYDNDFYNHDEVMTIIFLQMITSTMSMMSRLAARILAKKLLEGEGFEEGDRLKEIQEKVVIFMMMMMMMMVNPLQVGVEVGQMVERVDSVLHQEDFTLEEVLFAIWLI